MKQRLEGFLADDKIPHDSEPFDYIAELHDYLWRFIRVELGRGASGHIDDYIDKAIEQAERR